MAKLKEQIQKFGTRKLADECGVSPQAVHKWLTKKIPAERVIEVERITGLSRHELRSDLYPSEQTA